VVVRLRTVVDVILGPAKPAVLGATLVLPSGLAHQPQHVCLHEATRRCAPHPGGDAPPAPWSNATRIRAAQPAPGRATEAAHCVPKQIAGAPQMRVARGRCNRRATSHTRRGFSNEVWVESKGSVLTWLAPQRHDVRDQTLSRLATNFPAKPSGTRVGGGRAQTVEGAGDGGAHCGYCNGAHTQQQRRARCFGRCLSAHAGTTALLTQPAHNDANEAKFLP
jgi:hypothetical protein